MRVTGGVMYLAVYLGLIRQPARGSMEAAGLQVRTTRTTWGPSVVVPRNSLQDKELQSTDYMDYTDYNDISKGAEAGRLADIVPGGLLSNRLSEQSFSHGLLKVSPGYRPHSSAHRP
jgi:hypothetical protein